MRISRIPSTDPKSFGIFGGGGRSGSSTLGRVGKSGSSGSVGVGSTGSSGKITFAHGESGSLSFGRFGSVTGRIFISKSGTYTVRPARISCKSRMISGHFGNSMIGSGGTMKLISSK